MRKKGRGECEGLKKEGERFSKKCHDVGREFENPEIRANFFGGDVKALNYIDNAINVGMPPIFHAHPHTISIHNNASPKCKNPPKEDPTCKNWGY